MMFVGQTPFKGIVAGPGLLPGTVLQNTPDPGRVQRGVAKVWIPHIHGPIQPLPTTLPEAIVIQPWGGLPGLGISLMPSVGASVMVGFLLGDVEKPIVIGPYFGAEGLPPQAQASPLPDGLISIEHPSGWVVKLDFATSRLVMTHPTLNSIELDAEGAKVSKAGEPALARVIHEFGTDTFTGLPLGEATQGASAALKVSQAPQ
jgi:hypothetical protein